MTAFARICRLGEARDGATAVEMALIAPLLLLLTLGTMELGRLAWTQAALNFAVEEAARCASVRPDLCGAPAQTASYAAGKMAGLNVSSSVFTISTQACGTQVSARLPYGPKIYGVSTAPTLTATFCRS